MFFCERANNNIIVFSLTNFFFPFHLDVLTRYWNDFEKDEDIDDTNRKGMELKRQQSKRLADIIEKYSVDIKDATTPSSSNTKKRSSQHQPPKSISSKQIKVSKMLMALKLKKT